MTSDPMLNMLKHHAQSMPRARNERNERTNVTKTLLLLPSREKLLLSDAREKIAPPPSKATAVLT